MQDKHESKEEMVERLTQQFRELLQKKLPDAPGTLEEIERVTEEIGTEIKREIEDECLGCHGSGYVGLQMPCGCGGVSKFKNYYPKRVVSLCDDSDTSLLPFRRLLHELRSTGSRIGFGQRVHKRGCTHENRSTCGNDSFWGRIDGVDVMACFP